MTLPWGPFSLTETVAVRLAWWSRSVLWLFGASDKRQRVVKFDESRVWTRQSPLKSWLNVHLHRSVSPAWPPATCYASLCAILELTTDGVVTGTTGMDNFQQCLRRILNLYVKCSLSAGGCGGCWSTLGVEPYYNPVYVRLYYTNNWLITT